MYLFSDFNDIYKPGKLKRFVADLHSGKLHREFHYGADPSSAEKPASLEQHENPPGILDESIKSVENQIDQEESHRDSTFIKLAPSEMRYTLVRIRNEL